MSRVLVVAILLFLSHPTLAPNQWNVGGAATPLNGVARWDSAYYMNIGSEGYTTIQSYAFRPLFPAIMGALSFLGSPNVGWASETIFGFAWNLIVSLAAFYLLYRLTSIMFPGTGVPVKTTSLLAAYPSSFFLTVVYPEATALLLIISTILLLETRHLAAAAACGFLVGLTRPEGFLLFIPFMLKGIWSRDRSLIAGAIMVLASLPLFLIYALVRTGNLLVPAVAEQKWVKSTLIDVLSGNSGFTMLNPSINNLAIFLNVLTMLLAIGFLIHAFRSRKITDKIRPYYLWAWCLVLFVLKVGEVHSWARFTLVLIPLYWCQAATLDLKRLSVLLIVYGMMLTVGTYLFTNWLPML